MVGQTYPVSKASGGGFARQWRMVKRRWGLYLLLSIPVIYVFIFNYIPVYGVTLAFITGTRSLDEYDAYVEELYTMGLQLVLDAKNDAYSVLK